MRQLRRDKILQDVLGLGQGKRGLARLGLVSLETVLAQLMATGYVGEKVKNHAIMGPFQGY